MQADPGRNAFTYLFDWSQYRRQDNDLYTLVLLLASIQGCRFATKSWSFSIPKQKGVSNKKIHMVSRECFKFYLVGRSIEVCTGR